MSNVRVPKEDELQIMRENGIDDTKSYGVVFRDADTINLLCHLTRDNVIIVRGDRKW